MSRVPPIDPDSKPELKDLFEPYVKRMGFVPTSQRVMARRPKLVRGFAALAQAIFDTEESETPLELRNMVAYMASRTAGCMYCSAHTGNNAARSGLSDDKIAAIWEYETSDLFSDAERAALRYAQCAAAVPNLVTDEVMDELRKHFTDDHIVELTATICYYGYLNRWNDSMATPLEEEPLEFADRAGLDKTGWTPGKHASGDSKKSAA